MNIHKLPTDLNGKYIHVIEECAELQKAITKLMRFGPREYNPEDPKQTPNALAVLVEFDDLKYAFDRIRMTLEEEVEACGWKKS